MHWNPLLGEMDWADGHTQYWCPAVLGRPTAEQAAAAKKAWSMARSKRSPYHRFTQRGTTKIATTGAKAMPTAVEQPASNKTTTER